MVGQGLVRCYVATSLVALLYHARRQRAGRSGGKVHIPCFVCSMHMACYGAQHSKVALH